MNYINGIAESYRVIGVGNSYKNSIDTAIENYLNALSYFKRNKNLNGKQKFIITLEIFIVTLTIANP